MPYEHREYPAFSWSHTRNAVFQDCPRRYFYQYYGSHNGWEFDAPDEARRVYRLKQITNLPIEVGGAVHGALATALHLARSGKSVPSPEELWEGARNQLNRVWSQSKDRARWEREPRRRRMLHEFYYETGLSDQQVAEARDRARRCLANGLASDSFKEAVAAPFVEVKDVENLRSFDVAGTLVFGAPDLIYRLGDDTWVVVDWKTGREPEEPDWIQVALYALYVHDRHAVPEGQVHGRVEWLDVGSRHHRPLAPPDLEAARRQLGDSIAAMHTYLEDRVENRPRDRAAFPLRDDTTSCKTRCSFFELCREEIAASHSGPF